jgi:hypothetical protein
VFPEGHQRPAFAQIYVTGGDDEAEAHLRATQARSPVNEQLLLRLQRWLSMNNTYAQWFRMIGREHGPDPHARYVLRNYARADLDQRVYNAPRTLEVGMVINNDTPEEIGQRNITLQTVGGGLYHITDDYSGYLPIRYPVFFPYGEQGWIHGWPSGTERG